MRDIALSPYTLRPRDGGQARCGMLLRVEFNGIGHGYADCHPWPELGDVPLEVQRSRLESGLLTPLLQRSLALARADAEARILGESLFRGLEIPASHASIPNARNLSREQIETLSREGFERIKIKLGQDPAGEISRLQQVIPVVLDLNLRLRLDFNERLSVDSFLRFLDRVAGPGGFLNGWLDIVEDPCSYRAEDWLRIHDRLPVRLALDRVAGIHEDQEYPGVDVLVLKPAIQAPEPLIRYVESHAGVTLMVTSYLDHPVGQLGAAWCAAQALARLKTRMEICGLLTHRVYTESDFSAPLGATGPMLRIPQGVGLGFTQALEALPWQPISP